MNIDKKTVIDKIKKCLALSKSANVHEATAALRQARKLMEFHGISNLDMAHAEIEESKARSGACSRPAEWEAFLADVIAEQFGCRLLFLNGISKGYWQFIGFGPSADIANYAFAVLLRQLKKERQNYIKTKLRRCTSTQRRRADLFCLGWVQSAKHSLHGMGVSQEQMNAISTYIDARYGKQIAALKTTDRSSGRLGDKDYDDMWNGNVKGREASVAHAVNGVGQGLLEQK